MVAYMWKWVVVGCQEGHKLRSVGRYGGCKEGRGSEPCQVVAGACSSTWVPERGGPLPSTETDKVKVGGAWGGWRCRPWAGLGREGSFPPPSSLPPLALPHLYPVSGGGKGRSIRPSPLPSYTAQAVAWVKGNSRGSLRVSGK